MLLLQELRQLNEKYRDDIDVLEKQLRAAEASTQETAAQHEQALKEQAAKVGYCRL